MSEELDADIAIEAPGQVIHLDAELEEDIGAEIEDLILLRRLGYNRDAWEVITEVLLRHIRHFPVFAEVSAYLAYRGDDRMLDNLCSFLQLTDSTSTWNSQEIAYFQHVVDSGQGPLVLDLDVSKKDVPLDPVSLQLLEMCLHTAPGQSFYLNSLSGKAEPLSTLFVELIARKLWWDAANIFRKYCEYYPIRRSENAETKFVVNVYNNRQADYSKSVSLLLQELEADFESYLPKVLAILSAKAALMLYIVRIYDAEVEVLVKFVLAGMPPLRTLHQEVQAILRMLCARLGFDYEKSDYFVFGEACMNYWKHSEGCAKTVRRLNERVLKFTVSFTPTSQLPEIIATPFEHWLIQPPIAVSGKVSTSGTSPNMRLPLRTQTGCWTCRIRNANCDEARPSCGQCLLAGRACDYGHPLSFHDDTPRDTEQIEKVPVGSTPWDQQSKRSALIERSQFERLN